MGSGRGRGDRQARLRGTAVMPEPDCSNHLLLDTHFPLLSSYPPRAGMSRPGNERPRGGTPAPSERRRQFCCPSGVAKAVEPADPRRRDGSSRQAAWTTDSCWPTCDPRTPDTLVWFRSSVGAARNTPTRVRSMVAGIVDCPATNSRVVRAVSALGRAAGQSTGQGVSSWSGVRVRIAGGTTFVAKLPEESPSSTGQGAG